MNQADRERYSRHIVTWSEDPHPPIPVGPLITETGQQKQFASWLKDHNLLPPAVWHSTHKRSTGTVGCPDFIVPVRAVTLWLEFKLPGEDLSPDQKLFFARLREQGFSPFICYSALEAVQIVEETIALSESL